MKNKIYWTFKKCQEEASKYKTKIEFLENNKRAYQASYKKGWLNEICSHMETSGDKYNRCIYAYEFSDKSVYIGLTCNLNKRNKQHFSDIKSNNSVVKKHINETGLIPINIQLTDYILYSKASKLEGEYLNEYKISGWTILNKSKTGSLGASNLIYTKEKCKEILDKCVYLSDVYTNYSVVLSRCKENNWYLDQINRLIKKKNSNNYWNKERCIEISKNFTILQDFTTKCASAYNSIKKNGWSEICCSHMMSRKPKGYWNKERCQKESLKYKNRYSLQKGNISVYNASYDNKWLDEFFPK